MTTIRRTMALLLLGGLATADLASALTLEKVVAKHLAAHGGKDAWAAVGPIEITGSYTAFSKVHPFTLVRDGERLYRFEHVLDEEPVIQAWDGEDAWWINPWYGADWALPIAGPDRLALERDLDFVSPFFDYAERGFTAELVGPTVWEGQEVLQIDLVRTDGSEESWYLDPETFLEVARESPGSDFGQPMPQTTFFDDFRPVAGVLMPFFVESQWYTRDRVMQIESVEVGVELDPAIFRRPPPTGMADLQHMIGEWTVAVQERQGPRGPFVSREIRSTVVSLLGGALLEERFELDGFETVRSWTYDRYREVYRMTGINDYTTHLDVQVGTKGDDGRISVSNVETGTTWTGFGSTFHERTSLFDLREDGFEVEIEQSTDGGESWEVSTKMSYSRPDA